ncbi:MAG: TonB family protein [Gammaproteobacteria bacterium]|nr:TonB family protein [Gammaproteobacteria bacterium]
MRNFLLISVLLHAVAALLLQQAGTYRNELPLPGQTIALTLQTFSEPARSPQTTPAAPQETIRVQQAPAPAAGKSGMPVQDYTENAAAENAVIEEKITQPAQDRIENTQVENESDRETVAQAAQDNPGKRDTLNSLRAAVYSALQARFTYPRRARVQGWEGTVTVSLRIMPDGHLSEIRLADSSGVPLLDRAALRSLASISVPQVVAWLDGREIDMLIPVEYRLTDS